MRRRDMAVRLRRQFSLVGLVVVVCLLGLDFGLVPHWPTAAAFALGIAAPFVVTGLTAFEVAVLIADFVVLGLVLLPTRYGHPPRHRPPVAAVRPVPSAPASPGLSRPGTP